MIRYPSQKQLSLTEFEWPFQVALDETNRWVKLSQYIPWDELAKGYYQSLTERAGCPAKDARLVIGVVIIKHKLCLSDEETVAQIRENPYLQYFVGLPGYQMEAPFAPSLLVENRKRMGQSVFDVFQGAIIDAVESKKPKPKARTKTDDKDDDSPSAPGEIAAEETAQRQGKLILDATVTPQAKANRASFTRPILPVCPSSSRGGVAWRKSSTIPRDCSSSQAMRKDWRLRWFLCANRRSCSTRFSEGVCESAVVRLGGVGREIRWALQSDPQGQDGPLRWCEVIRLMTVRHRPKTSGNSRLPPLAPQPQKRTRT